MSIGDAVWAEPIILFYQGQCAHVGKAAEERPVKTSQFSQVLGEDCLQPQSLRNISVEKGVCSV